MIIKPTAPASPTMTGKIVASNIRLYRFLVNQACFVALSNKSLHPFTLNPAGFVDVFPSNAMSGFTKLPICAKLVKQEKPAFRIMHDSTKDQNF